VSRLTRVLLGLWGSLSIYLPLLVMGGLGLGTYWLYRNTPDVAAPRSDKPLAHEADYFMKGFSIRTLNTQGDLRSEVRGQRLLHYEDTQTLEIERVELFFWDKQGLLTNATAQHAISNADGSEVQLMGNARVVREPASLPNGMVRPAMSFEGEFLHVFTQTERIRSHKPVLVTRGTDRIQASSLDFSHLDRTAQFTGGVQMTFEGRAKSARPTR
jgi:lipopolysaccharide export system protein LptC